MMCLRSYLQLYQSVRGVSPHATLTGVLALLSGLKYILMDDLDVNDLKSRETKRVVSTHLTARKVVQNK